MTCFVIRFDRWCGLINSTTAESENMRPTDGTKERPADISEEHSVLVLVFWLFFYQLIINHRLPENVAAAWLCVCWCVPSSFCVMLVWKGSETGSDSSVAEESWKQNKCVSAVWWGQKCVCRNDSWRTGDSPQAGGKMENKSVEIRMEMVTTDLRRSDGGIPASFHSEDCFKQGDGGGRVQHSSSDATNRSWSTMDTDWSDCF